MTRLLFPKLQDSKFDWNNIFIFRPSSENLFKLKSVYFIFKGKIEVLYFASKAKYFAGIAKCCCFDKTFKETDKCKHSTINKDTATTGGAGDFIILSLFKSFVVAKIIFSV